MKDMKCEWQTFLLSSADLSSILLLLTHVDIGEAEVLCKCS